MRRPRQLLILFVVCAAFTCPASSAAEQVYYGIEAGSANGVFGGIPGTEYDTELHAGFAGNDTCLRLYRIRTAPLLAVSFRQWLFPVTLGWGVRFRGSAHPQVGLSGVIRFSYELPWHKLQGFCDLAPSFRLTPGYGINMEWALGVRLRFRGVSQTEAGAAP